MATIHIDDMFRLALAELQQARRHLSEAASWARSDWTERRSLTAAESAARTAVFGVVGQCKAAIDEATGLICRIDEERAR